MYYVYILKSRDRDWRYVGFTSDLKERFRSHNAGENQATRPYQPFRLVSYIAVRDKLTALELEKYFKSGSGIAWMNKRLMPKD